MVRIYIRHSEKTYRNGQNETFKHDPPITEEGKVQARQLAYLLIQKYGVPILIMCSPYRRTRETAEAMMGGISSVIRCDSLLSEYLGNHEETDVTVETASFEPPHHDESLGAFKARIRKHNTLASVLDDLTQPVWFITHGFIMSTLADIIGGNVRGNKQRHPFKKILPLGCLYIEKTVIPKNIANVELHSFLDQKETTLPTTTSPTRETTKAGRETTRAVLLRFPSLYRHMTPRTNAIITENDQPPGQIGKPPPLIPASESALDDTDII